MEAGAACSDDDWSLDTQELRLELLWCDARELNLVEAARHLVLAIAIVALGATFSCSASRPLELSLRAPAAIAVHTAVTVHVRLLHATPELKLARRTFGRYACRCAQRSRFIDNTALF